MMYESQIGLVRPQHERSAAKPHRIAAAEGSVYVRVYSWHASSCLILIDINKCFGVLLSYVHDSR